MVDLFERLEKLKGMNMSGEWIGVIGTLVGVLAGGGVTFFVTHAQIKHTDKLERRPRQLAKLEATHKLFSRISQQANLININVIGRLAHGVKFESERMGGKLPFDELQLHADMYIPEVSNIVQTIIEEWGKFAKIVVEIITKSTITDDEKKDYILKSTEISSNIDKLSKEAKQVVVKNTQKYL